MSERLLFPWNGVTENRIAVLVLGNGFDIAHDLETRYSDFLEICREVTSTNWLEIFDSNDYSAIPSIANLLSNSGRITENTHQIFQKMKKYLEKNIWYEYFERLHRKNCMQGENWIDFEKEMSFVIESLDKYTQNLSDFLHGYFKGINENEILEEKRSLIKKYENRGSSTKSYSTKSGIIVKSAEDEKNEISLKIAEIEQLNLELLKKELFVNAVNFCDKNLRNTTFKQFRKILFEDLKKFICAFEIYLVEFVEKIPIKLKSPDFKDLDIKYIFTFNYTHTYNKKVIDHFGVATEVSHVHGECKKEIEIEDNNMVLGIDEYWDDEKKDSHTNYSIFKKFVQRIQKKTAIENAKASSIIFNLQESVFEDGRARVNAKVEVFFYGHSLDTTDKDILMKFFELKDVNIIIFCYDEPTEGEYIANVIKLIGQDTLVERMEEGTIEFRRQQAMVPIEQVLIL